MGDEKKLYAERIAEIVREHLTDIYCCNREWSGWQAGTMTEGDFTPAGEIEMADEIALAILNSSSNNFDEEMACIKLLADIRQACGDDGQRMQGDLVEYIAELYRKSESVPKDWKPISTAPIGDSVSVDVSTCDEDSTNRVFGVISHCQPDGEGGVIWVCELDHFNFDIQTVKQPISVPKGTQVTTDNSKVTFIQKEYEKFSKWCRDNPAYDLDPRLHAHAGQIGHGGYISHRKSSTVFKGWLAAQEQDHE